MSECIRGTCPHKRGAFIWLYDGPDADGTYPWVHDTTMLAGRMVVCDLMPGATPAEAGEACARCGCGSHEHKAPPKGPPPNGTLHHSRGPCACGSCPGMVYRTEARRPANVEMLTSEEKQPTPRPDLLQAAP